MGYIRAVLSWLFAAAVAVVVAAFLTVFVMQPVLVEGSSMENTLHNNDKAIIQKLGKTFGRAPQYGDIVVIDSRVDRPRTIRDDFGDAVKNNLLSVLLSKNRQRQNIFWIKRVIGLPGDTIEIKDGAVYRNGERLIEPYIKEPMRPAGTVSRVELGDDEIFVMGDNRNESCDSRFLGPIPLSHVIGTVFFTF